MPELNELDPDDFAVTRTELLASRGYDLGPETRNGNGSHPGNGTQITLRAALPSTLHRRLRIKALERGLSLKQAVILAVEEWTSR